jgi:plastocyanin
MPARLLAVGVLGFLIAIALPASAANQGVTFGSDFKYTPATVHIAAGETVTFTPAAGNDFDTSAAATHHPLDFTDASIPDQTSGSSAVTRTFAQPGTYTYFCRNHSSLGMTGTVVVDAPAAAPGSGTTNSVSQTTSTTTSTSQTTTSGQTTSTPTTPVPGTSGDHIPPKVTLTKLTFSGLRRHGAVIRLRLSEAARASAAVTVRRTTVARGAKTYTSAGTRTLTLKLTAAGQRLLGRTPRVSGVLRLTVRDTAGNTTKRTRSVKLRA